MDIKVFAVLDTNVLVSAMIGKRESYPSQIMEYVISENIIPVVDINLIEEYNDVLNRAKLKGQPSEIKQVLDTIIQQGVFVQDVEQIEIILPDEKDVPIYRIKEDTEELDSYLVTGNIKDFPMDPHIVTPKTMISIMNTMNFWVEKGALDVHLEATRELISSITQMSKYDYAKDVLEIVYRDGKVTAQTVNSQKVVHDEQLLNQPDKAVKQPQQAIPPKHIR